MINRILLTVIEVPSADTDFGAYLRNLWEWWNHGILYFFVQLKRFVVGMNSFFQGIDNIKEQMEYLIVDNGISLDGSNYLILNQYIGNVRYVTGDFVFTEIYVLLLLGLLLFVFQIFAKIIEALKSFMSVAGQFKLFDGIVDFFGNIFKMFY